MSFTKAIKREAKLRMAIAGPSGSGKTYTALAIASALANGKPVAVVDTEHGSASKYADLFQFDVLEMHPPYHPDRFVEAINEAAKAGYGVVILDSLTHAWSGTGGLLEVVDQIAARMRSQNSFAAWKDATPIQNHLVEAIVAAPLHVIATMRSKQEYVVQQDERGKQAPRKVGMAPQQREGFEYEFDVFGEMDIDNTMIVTKSRCPALSGAVIKKPGADVAATLTTWLHGVAQPAQSPQLIITPTPPPPAVVVPAPEPQGEQADPQPSYKLADPKRVTYLRIMCDKIYGEKADKTRADLCLWASRGSTPHSAELADDEAEEVIKVLEERMVKVGYTRDEQGRWSKEPKKPASQANPHATLEGSIATLKPVQPTQHQQDMADLFGPQ